MFGNVFDLLRHVRRRRMWAPDKAAGRRGEDLAHRFLRRRGFTIVARNYRLAAGDAEADIIVWERDTLVIVEVKSRESEEFGPPERAIGIDKQRNLIRVAVSYMRKADVPWERVRFDVVAVVLGRRTKVEHFRGIFSPSTWIKSSDER